MNRAFRKNARQAIENKRLRQALNAYSAKKRRTFSEAFTSLPDPDRLRQEARTIRKETLENLDHHLSTFIENISKNGFQVHQANNADQANQIVLELIRTSQAKRVVKSKTMVSEEIHLNIALASDELEVVETDLGEFIVQLREEPPSHLVAPAIHLRREDVAQTFAEKLGMGYTTDVGTMNRAARESLREMFLSADIGISGVNFGIAETGTLCVITNEGNGRMVTTLPKMHIALMGVERLLPHFADLSPMLALLPRSATGQKLTSYVHLIQGPRREADPEGPAERHLILVDNGRFALAESWLSEALYCIRCGACTDACPVYREVGGHAYDSVYSGPIGSVVSPGLFGVKDYGHLAKASSLCGACQDVCPVGIDIPSLLLRVRSDYSHQTPGIATSRFAMRVFTWLASNSRRFRWGQRLGSWAMKIAPKRRGWARWLPPPASSWTSTRDFPTFTAAPFHDRFNEIDQMVVDPSTKELVESNMTSMGAPITDPVTQFGEELERLEGHFTRCKQDQVSRLITEKLLELGCKRILCPADDPSLGGVIQELISDGFEIVEPHLIEGIDREIQLKALADVTCGFTGASAAIAETGTLVLSTANSQLASLLPMTHVALISSDQVYATFDDWVSSGGVETLRQSQSISLISGPSRTADIEMTLTLGVHGPGRVIVFCVG